MHPGTGRQVGIKTGEVQSFGDYEKFFAAFEKQLRYFMEIAAEKDDLELLIERKQNAFRSSLMENGIATVRIF